MERCENSLAALTVGHGLRGDTMPAQSHFDVMVTWLPCDCDIPKREVLLGSAYAVDIHKRLKFFSESQHPGLLQSTQLENNTKKNNRHGYREFYKRCFRCLINGDLRRSSVREALEASKDSNGVCFSTMYHMSPSSNLFVLNSRSNLPQGVKTKWDERMEKTKKEKAIKKLQTELKEEKLAEKQRYSFFSRRKVLCSIGVIWNRRREITLERKKAAEERRRLEEDKAKVRDIVSG